MSLFVEHLTYFCNGAVWIYFVVMAAYFFRHRQDSTLKKALGYVLFFWAMMLLSDIAYMHPAVKNSDFLYSLKMTIDMWVVPTCVFYAMALLRPKSLTPRKVVFHFVPFILLSVWFACSGERYVFIAAIVWAIVYSGWIFVYLVVGITKYNKALRDNYSNLDYVNVRWLKIATSLLIFCLFCWVYVCFHISFLTDIFYYLIIILLWSVIGFYSLHQQIPDSFEPGAEVEADAVQDAKPNFTFVPRLRQLLFEEEIYRNPKLTMSDLVTLLGTNRTYLSVYLNSTLGVSFFDFINAYRLRYAMGLLLDPECRFTQEEIAEQAGFNSLSTFRRAFNRQYKCSPTEYKKKNEMVSEWPFFDRMN